MSSLRSRLNSIGTAPKPAVSLHPRGVRITETRFDADEGMFALSAPAMRRMGWSGGVVDPEKLLFLDTETTGLSGGAGTVAFLAGLGYIRGKTFIVEQYLMQDYSDEPDMLEAIAKRMELFNGCVTYNGRNFDIPLLNGRFVMNRMADRQWESDQLDLLNAARRAWKLRLGRCKLCDIEEQILGRPRQHDIPGSEVPQRYFDFLKSGNFALLDDIILHNRQDIVSLMTILCRLNAVYARPEDQTEQQDLFSLGKALERQGELGKAKELYRLSAIPAGVTGIRDLSRLSVAGMANWRHYLLLRRCRDWEGAKEILEQMIHRKQLRELPYIEMAKIAEHREHAFAAALDYTRKALAICPEEQKDALVRRKTRIIQKMDQEDHHGIF